jgi:hypothetical protein
MKGRADLCQHGIDFRVEQWSLIHHQKKLKTSLALIDWYDRIRLPKQSITNEVKTLWHKAFFPTSMKKRATMRE